jgi:hypothetical protein
MGQQHVSQGRTHSSFGIHSVLLFTLCVLCASCAQLPRKDVFFFPIESDDIGYRIELNWNGEGSSSEAKRSTGEYGQPFDVTRKLSFEDRELRSVLVEIFQDVDRAAKSAECYFVGAAAIVCRNANGLAIKERNFPRQGGKVVEEYVSSKPFVSSADYVLCLYSLAGPGACRNILPESVFKRWKRRYR